MRSILISVLLTLGACSSAPTSNEIDTADFGLDVSEEACLAVAKPFIREQVGDPDSAVFQAWCAMMVRGRVWCATALLAQPMITDSAFQAWSKNRES